MVETINELQTELFRSDLEEDLELLDKIRDIGLRLEAPISSDDVPGIGINFEETIHGLQRRIFMNKCLWLRPKRFGALFVLDEEFVSDKSSPDNLEYR